MNKEFLILSRKAQADKNWECVNAALGEADQSIQINIAGNSISGSLLPMLETHLLNSPKSKYVATEEVQITTLDKLSPKYLHRNDKLLLKMDVQGYELSILKGASETLSHSTLIESELSLVPLYDRQVLYREMIDYLATKGFQLVYIHNGFMDKVGRVLQVDAIFANIETLQ